MLHKTLQRFFCLLAVQHVAVASNNGEKRKKQRRTWTPWNIFFRVPFCSCSCFPSHASPEIKSRPVCSVRQLTFVRMKHSPFSSSFISNWLLDLCARNLVSIYTFLLYVKKEKKILKAVESKKKTTWILFLFSVCLSSRWLIPASMTCLSTLEGSRLKSSCRLHAGQQWWRASCSSGSSSRNNNNGDEHLQRVFNQWFIAIPEDEAQQDSDDGLVPRQASDRCP